MRREKSRYKNWFRPKSGQLNQTNILTLELVIIEIQKWRKNGQKGPDSIKPEVAVFQQRFSQCVH